MSVEIKNNPPYVKDAKFIDATDNVEEDVWPKNIRYYARTNKWNSRIETLKQVIDQEDIDNTVKYGDIYKSLSNSVTFVRSISGVAIYVIVSAELVSCNGEYPTNPSIHDYKYKAVTVWLYVYDERKAKESSAWTDEDINFIHDFCEQESGQSEASKHGI
jgi:hypothetical protein